MPIFNTTLLDETVSLKIDLMMTATLNRKFSTVAKNGVVW
jgi:hypothetical protein